MDSSIIFGIIGLVIGLLIGTLIAWLASKFTMQKQTEDIRIQLAETGIELRSKSEKLQTSEQSQNQLQVDNGNLRIHVAQLQKASESDTEKIAWIEQAQVRMREAFEALASQSLHANSTEFVKRASEQVESLLNQAKSDWGTQKVEFTNLVNPLQLNLQVLDGYVRELEQKREGAYQGVTEQLRQITQSHSTLQSITTTLAQALKSSTVRGRWGEIQLRRVAEMSGMQAHISFREQVTTDDGRPDMTILLPNGGVIPVDSKSPMEAYFESVSSNEYHVKKSKMYDHIKAMEGRIRELSQKQYWTQFDKSPDFVVMFVPSESCVSAAFDSKPELMEFAFEHKVMITTPVSFLALLKAIAYGWQQQQIAENTEKIAHEGKELYKRLEIFTKYLTDISTNLTRTVQSYNNAVGSFESRLLPAARRFEGLGIGEKELAAINGIDVTVRAITANGVLAE